MTITIEESNKSIANISFIDGRSLKNKTEINNAITNSICPTALTGATAFAENA